MVVMARFGPRPGRARDPARRGAAAARAREWKSKTAPCLVISGLVAINRIKCRPKDGVRGEHVHARTIPFPSRDRRPEQHTSPNLTLTAVTSVTAMTAATAVTAVATVTAVTAITVITAVNAVNAVTVVTAVTAMTAVTAVPPGRKEGVPHEWPNPE